MILTGEKSTCFRSSWPVIDGRTLSACRDHRVATLSKTRDYAVIVASNSAILRESRVFAWAEGHPKRAERGCNDSCFGFSQGD